MPPIFAGEEAIIGLCIANTGRRPATVTIESPLGDAATRLAGAPVAGGGGLWLHDPACIRPPRGDSASAGARAIGIATGSAPLRTALG